MFESMQCHARPATSSSAKARLSTARATVRTDRETAERLDLAEGELGIVLTLADDAALEVAVLSVCRHSSCHGECFPQPKKSMRRHTPPHITSCTIRGLWISAETPPDSS